MKKHSIFRLQLFAEGAEGTAQTTQAAQAAQAAQANQAAQAAQEGGQSEPAGEPEAVQVSEQPKNQADADLVRQHWQGVERIYRELEGQAQELKQLYPDFDLASELKDARFGRMLRSGVDMASAFQALHAGEILPAAMEYAARTVQQRMTSALGSGADRPPENGLRSGGAVMMGSQIAQMSRQDYANICRMVERGERISFG